jgi:hypothetical protein
MDGAKMSKELEKKLIQQWQKEVAEKYYSIASEQESQYEMSAAFGSGVEVVNIVTGKRYITK